MKTKHQALTLILFVLSILQSCNFNADKKNFFLDSKRGDLDRIPLIEPFELYKPSSIGKIWFFDLPFNNNGLLQGQIKVDEMCILTEDSILLFYSYRVNIPGKVTDVWYSIDLKKKQEYHFINETKFKSYLDNLRGKAGLNFLRCEDVYTFFVDSSIWIHR